jgi:hypothetical protein
MKTFTKIALALSLAFSVPAYADEYVDTLNILRDKGILTQKEYDAKIQAYEERAENKKFAEQRIDKDVSESVKFRQAKANDGAVTENDLDSKVKMATPLPSLLVEYTWTIDNTHQITVQVKPRIRIRT